MFPLFDLHIVAAISASCWCCLTANTSSQCSVYVICIGGGAMLQFPLWVCTCENIPTVCIPSALQLPCHWGSMSLVGCSGSLQCPYMLQHGKHYAFPSLKPLYFEIKSKLGLDLTTLGDWRCPSMFSDSLGLGLCSSFLSAQPPRKEKES